MDGGRRRVSHRPVRQDVPNGIICVTGGWISVRRISDPVHRICVTKIGCRDAVGKIGAIGSVSVGVTIRIYRKVGIDALGSDGRQGSNWRTCDGCDRGRGRRCTDRRTRRHRRRWGNRTWRHRSDSRLRRDTRGRGRRRAACQAANNRENCRDQNNIFCIHITSLDGNSQSSCSSDRRAILAVTVSQPTG